MRKTLLGECAAECVGTFVMIAIGLGSVAGLVTMDAGIGWVGMAFVWGLAVALAIYIAGGVSGAHLNPAVTVALAVWNGFDRKKVAPFIVSQLLGAFLGAAVVYGLFRNAIIDFEAAKGIVRASAGGMGSAGIFSTFPHSSLSLLGAGLVELFITAILMLVILATTDGANNAAPKGGLAALAIGMTVTACGIAFGPLTGFAMNPARDLGPRIFVLLSGWDSSALGSHYYGLIVPVFAPILGAIAGGAVYHKLTVPFLPKALAPAVIKKEGSDLAS